MYILRHEITIYFNNVQENLRFCLKKKKKGHRKMRYP